MPGPLFEIDQVQLQFPLGNDLQKLLVASNHMYLFVSRYVYHIDLLNPSEVLRFSYPDSGNATLDQAWVHPNGVHLLIRLTDGTIHFLHAKLLTSFKPLAKLKQIGSSIQDIIFFPEEVPQEGGILFLAYTSTNDIYLGEIKTPTDSKLRVDKHLKLILNESESINGMAYVKNILYIFSGNTSVSTWKFNGAPEGYSEAVSFFKSSTPHSHKYNNSSSSNIGSKSYLTSNNTNSLIYYYGEGQFYTIDSELMLSGIRKLPSLFLDHLLGPIGITPHHVFTKSRGQITFMNKLSSHTTSLNIPTNLASYVCDTKENTFWLYSSNDIYELVIVNEETSVWYDYYKMGKYDEALKCLQPTMTYESDMVLIKKSYELLTSDDANAALKGVSLLAETSEPFEKVLLMLMKNESTLLLLIEYIKAKFYQTKKENSKIRKVILSSWLIRLILTGLYQKNQNSHHEILNSQLTEFLKKNYKVLDTPIVYQIMKDFSAHDKLVEYAEFIQDYETIVNYYIEREDWKNALKYIVHVYNEESLSNEIIYSTATILLLNFPKKTVETWLKFKNIQYERFLAAILVYNRQLKSKKLEENYGCYFLQRIILEKGITNSRIVNNYYLLLLITINSPASNKQIVQILNKTLNFDKNYLLRLSLNQTHNYELAVQFCIHLALFEQALQLALSRDLVELGEFVLIQYDEYLKRENMNSGDGTLRNGALFLDTEEGVINFSAIKLHDKNYSTKEKLKLMFAKYLIDGVIAGQKFSILQEESFEYFSQNGSNDDHHINGETAELNKALHYLLKGGFLMLKDLLPLFPESINISEFKQEIITSLNTYNSNINQLSNEMNESLSIYKKLKEQQVENTSSTEVLTLIEPGESCRLCHKLLVDRNFIVFPNCLHNFHKDCLIKFYLKLKNNYKFRKLYDAFKSGKMVDKHELDALLLTSCPLCNEQNISTVDLALVDPIAHKLLMSEWEL